jgi:hypothetical protein
MIDRQIPQAIWSHQLIWLRQRLATLVQLSRHNSWRGSDESGTLSVGRAALILTCWTSEGCSKRYRRMPYLDDLPTFAKNDKGKQPARDICINGLLRR